MLSVKDMDESTLEVPINFSEQRRTGERRRRAQEIKSDIVYVHASGLGLAKEASTIVIKPTKIKRGTKE